MSAQRDWSCRLLAVVLLCFVVLATWYSLRIPLGEAPDEVPHFTYVRYLMEHGRLPATIKEHEGFQPPLYYALGAALTFWIEDEADAPFTIRTNAHRDEDDPRAPKNLLLHTTKEDWPYRGWVLAWHVARLLSIVFGAVTVWAVFQLGRVFFPDKPAIPLTMAALTAFTPQFLYMSAVFNNDNAATAFSALVLWQVAVLLHRPERAQSWKHSALLGLLLGLALLSKANLLSLVPVVGLAVLVSGLRGQRTGEEKRGLPVGYSLLLVAGIAALLAGWYFVRNWLLWGDPLGWSFILQVSDLREGPLTPDVLAWLFEGIFRSFWLGWIGIAFENAVYWVIGAVCLVGLAGFVTWLIRRRHALDRATYWMVGLIGVQAAITLVSLVQWTATVLGTDQGRLIYPLLPAVMFVLTAGWAWWTRKRAQTWVFGGLIAGMLALALITPSRYIAPVHAPAPVATEAELEAATPLNVDWDGIRLLGYRLESTQVQPGEKLVLDLYWLAQQPIGQDVMAHIQLVDESETFLMYMDGSPTAGRDTTDRWTPGVPLASRHLLPIPDKGQPGDYRLRMGLHFFGEETWLSITEPDGSVVVDHLVLPETIRLIAP
jgi:4-amino-4-deoxy-L-arabinose transferase-like glycosyltransferase